MVALAPSERVGVAERGEHRLFDSSRLGFISCPSGVCRTSRSSRGRSVSSPLRPSGQVRDLPIVIRRVIAESCEPFHKQGIALSSGTC
jgi:hypothetical protein